MDTGSHFSIGDVLDQLRPEFSDITISKIRFLESQGLIDPERTPSGYRRFYPADVERLRFILREQREHFLPLKVIKERLDDLDTGGAAAPAPATGARRGARSGSDGGPAGGTATGGARPRRKRSQPAQQLFETALRVAELDDAQAIASAVRDEDGDEQLTAPNEAVLTRAELARAAGITDDQLAQLEDFGLVAPAHTSRDRVLFDEDALAIARVAGGFLRHGIEARHLRMYRASAEREAGLFEQVLLPYRRQRNPEAQARVHETLAELAGLGRQLRTALLRQAVRRSLTG